ncbi:MAG: hypothetical protein NT149_05165 [Candidatus Gottesmanbacteria bacterium]|nr:hypothetical protein [Candidatus Gottesmanbacteria bacterium]
MKKNIATVISRIFEPTILLPVAFVACAVRVGVSFEWSIFWLALMLVPTTVYRMVLKKVQKIDWDIQDRKKRVKPLTLLVCFLGSISVFVWVFEPRLLPLLVLFLVWVVGFLCVTTLVTKISGHAGGDALATGMIIHWFGWCLWPILFIVPLVGWARVVRRDHSVAQVIAGVVYSWTLIGIFTKIFNF